MIAVEPHETTWVWVSYLLGAFLVLAFKYARYLYAYRCEPTGNGHTFKEHFKTATLIWFFGRGDARTQSQISWITTVGIVWLFGGFVVGEGILNILPEMMRQTTSHEALAFVLGSLMEMIAPKIGEGIVSRIAKLIGDG